MDTKHIRLHLDNINSVSKPTAIMGNSQDRSNSMDDVHPTAPGARDGAMPTKLEEGTEPVPPYAAAEEADEGMLGDEQAALIDYKTLTWWYVPPRGCPQGLRSRETNPCI